MKSNVRHFRAAHLHVLAAVFALVATMLVFTAASSSQATPGGPSAAAASLSLKAQAGNARPGKAVITGRVTSRSGKPLGGVTVVAYGTRKGAQHWSEKVAAATDAQGNYRLTGLQSGSYEIRFTDGT
ncbi:MAG: carboxypeptidase regulatory-like domain-containing protein [Nocardioides sp.]|jgi:protocatechuate 3,4-dioxygenase beta subunit